MSIYGISLGNQRIKQQNIYWKDDILKFKNIFEEYLDICSIYKVLSGSSYPFTNISIQR